MTARKEMERDRLFDKPGIFTTNEWRIVRIVMIVGLGVVAFIVYGYGGWR